MSIKVLFLDVGGVLLTNGWDTEVRRRVSEYFHLDLEEFTRRHQLIFDTYEIGKLSFDDYLEEAIFYLPRGFSKREVLEFGLQLAKPYLEMIEMVQVLKREHGFRLCTLSNEGRELAQDRVSRFQLDTWIDFFLFSGDVGMRKPDPDLYKLALNIAKVAPEEALYIDDRKPLVMMAERYGLQALHHETPEKTRALILHHLVGSGV